MCRIPGGETIAAFPAEPTRERVRAASAGQGRPTSAARSAGRLDRRLIRRATLRVFGSEHASEFRPAPPVIDLCSPVAIFVVPVFSAPALSEGARRGGYRDACSIARSVARTIGRVFDTPSEGHPIPRWGARPPGAAGRPPAASRAPRLPKPRSADRCPSKPEGMTVHGIGRAWQSEGTAKEPPLCHFTQHGDSCVGKVAAGGRAARPTKRGRNYEERQCACRFLAGTKGYKSGVPLLYPSIDVRGGLSDGSLFDSPQLGSAALDDDPTGSPFLGAF